MTNYGTHPRERKTKSFEQRIHTLLHRHLSGAISENEYFVQLQMLLKGGRNE